jgi:hypothetical protein
MSSTQFALAVLTVAIAVLAACNVAALRLAYGARRPVSVSQQHPDTSPTHSNSAAASVVPPASTKQTTASQSSTRRTTLLGLPYKYVVPVLSSYAVVTILGLGYAIVYFGSRYPNSGFDWPEASQRDSAIIAGMLAIPLALGLIWDRISKVKILDFELDISATKPQVVLELADDVKGVDLVMVSDSGGEEIRKQIKTAIARAGASPLIEVRLESCPAWWSTRLYLLAALAGDYTEIERLVFFEQEHGQERRFVGMATPLATREALAKVHPTLEMSYLAALAGDPPASGMPAGALPPPRKSEEQLDSTMRRFGSQFQTRHPGQSESAVRHIVTGDLLRRWLGADLKRPLVDTDGAPITELTYWEIINQEEPFVALVRSGRLIQMVDRIAVATQVAQDVIRWKLKIARN